MLKVVIDGTVFTNSYQIGIWRTFYEVINRLKSEVDFSIVLDGPPIQPIPSDVAVHNRFETVAENVTTPLRRWLSRARRFRAHQSHSPAKRLDCDIFHASYFAIPSDLPSKSRIVVSIYDMIAEKHFGILRNWVEADIRRKRDALSKADAVLAISRTTLQEWAKFFSDKEVYNDFVHLGCEHQRHDRQAPLRITCQVDPPFVLVVGQRGGYKNFIRILDSMETPDWPLDLHLRLVGPPLSSNELNLIRAMGLTERINVAGKVTDEELTRLYKTAKCFVFPSLEEGFGIPVLEAMGNRCLTVLSDIPVFREVAGESAIYFNPHDPTSLAKAVRDSLNSPRRDQLIESGMLRLENFSWDDCADKTLAFYNEVMRRPKRATQNTDSLDSVRT